MVDTREVLLLRKRQWSVVVLMVNHWMSSGLSGHRNQYNNNKSGCRLDSTCPGIGLDSMITSTVTVSTFPLLNLPLSPL